MNNENKTIETFHPLMSTRLKFLEDLNQSLSPHALRVEDVIITVEDDGNEGTAVFVFRLFRPEQPLIAVFNYGGYCYSEQNDGDCLQNDEGCDDCDWNEFCYGDSDSDSYCSIDDGRFSWPEDIFDFFEDKYVNRRQKREGERILSAWCKSLIWGFLKEKIPDELESVLM